MQKRPRRKKADAGAKVLKAPKKVGQTIPDRRPDFCVVGIGASAGGVEAFTQLIEHLPANSGMAFVLVPHLAPAHKSELALVLSRKSAIPIAEAKDDEKVEPNRVYVIPPNKQMVFEGGRLRLSPSENRTGGPRSIDIFLESLAQERGQYAIGVILSGTATDGTLGLEAIKGEGGFTFAQDSSARHDSMPRSAISSGCVDLVLSPEAIARELVRISRHPFFRKQGVEFTKAERESIIQPEAGPLPPVAGNREARTIGTKTGRRGASEFQEQRAPDDPFGSVMALLRNHVGVDFSLYKSNTIQRRILRRAVLNKCNSLNDYAKILKGNAQELDSLYSDVLISVTSFFRNPEVFDFLKREVFPKLFGERRNDPIRVWVLGCSTGQEAYSLAMILDEYFDNRAHQPKVQIFASDLNESVLARARTGLYTKTLAQDISPARLRRYFTEENGGYRINKSLRDSVVFARQNVIHDPPFSRMDLITCRNVLIYLDGSLNKRIIPTLHYALKPSGFLVLGSSESVGTFADLFEPLDRRHKIYVKKPSATPALEVGLSFKTWGKSKPDPAKPAEVGATIHPQVNVQREADRVALNRYVPPSVLVNESLQVLHFRGETSTYLKPPMGRPTFNLFRMVKEGLLSPLRATLNQSLKQHKGVRKTNVDWIDKGEARQTSIEVIPLTNLKERCYLVFFEERESAAEPRPNDSREPVEGRPRKASEWRNRVNQLERALAESRDYLQSVQEQYEAMNEELQASNEEATSANEELQSTNEELETSKEELESTNEELTTVNDEVASRNAELMRANSDLNNLYANVNMPIVLLARDLTIRHFTKPAEKLFNLLAADVGRSITSLKPNLEIADLEPLLLDVIESVSLRESEVRSRDGQWYVLRARPYFTPDRKVDGAVLLAVDVDQLKLSEQRARMEREKAQAILHAAPVPLLVLSSDLKVELTNEAFYRVFKTNASETEGRLIFHLGNGQWNIPRLRNFLEEIIPRNSFIKDFEVTHEFPIIGRRTLYLNARRLDAQSPAGQRVLIALDDYTDRLQAQETVRSSELRFRRLFETSRDGILLVDPVTRKISDSNPFMRQLLGMKGEALAGKELWQVGILRDEQMSHGFFRQLQEKGVTRAEYVQVSVPSGGVRHLELVANRYRENGHETIQCNIRDVTERRQNEDSIAKSKEDLEIANRTLEQRVIERTASLEALNDQLTELSTRLISAQEDERRRIARELHDGVGAMLVALKLQLHPIGSESPSEGQMRAEPLLAEVTRQVRQLSLELHPQVLDDLGLKAAVSWHIRGYEERTGISVKFDPETIPTTRFSPNMEITIFRIIQEALTNVARHAQTSRAEVRFYPEEGEVKLEIRDEGKGFSPEKDAGKVSLGLTGMKERVLLMNGTFEIISNPGHGTKISVSLPSGS